MPAVPILTEGDILAGEVGVFVRQVGQNASIRGDTSFTVGIIGDMPWGPENAWTEITSAIDLLATFFPFGTHTYGNAYADLSGVPFGRLKIYNAKAFDAVKATRTFGDNDTPTAQNSLVATARYFGVGGNGITIAPNGSGTVVRSVTSGTVVMWRDTYTALQASNGNVTDPSDDFVTYAKASGADEYAASASQTLTGGSSGTMTAAELLAGLDAGLGEDIDIFVFVGVSTSLIDAVRAGCLTFANANPDKRVVLPSLPTTDDADAAITDIASYRGTYANVWASHPRGTRRVSYSYRGYPYSVSSTGRDLAVDLACCLQRVSPWTPAMLKHVKGMTPNLLGLAEVLDRTTKANLSAAGITTWIVSKPLGGIVVPYNEVTTTVTSTNTLSGEEEAVDGVATRYYLYCQEALTAFLEPSLADPLDINLVDRTMGPSCGSKVAAINAFFEGEKIANRVVAGFNADRTAAPAYYVDPYGLATQDDLDAGRWTIAISARRTPHAKQFVLNLAIAAGQDIFVTNG